MHTAKTTYQPSTHHTHTSTEETAYLHSRPHVLLEALWALLQPLSTFRIRLNPRNAQVMPLECDEFCICLSFMWLLNQLSCGQVRSPPQQRRNAFSAVALDQSPRAGKHRQFSRHPCCNPSTPAPLSHLLHIFTCILMYTRVNDP